MTKGFRTISHFWKPPETPMIFIKIKNETLETLDFIDFVKNMEKNMEKTDR